VATLQELEQRVRDTTENLDPVVNAAVPDYLRAAQAEAEDRHIFLAMEGSVAELVTTTGQRKLADKPADWLRRLDVPVWVHGMSGRHVPFEWAGSRGQLHQLYSASPDATHYGSPRHLLELEAELWVYPLPDALNPAGTAWSLGTYPVHIWYAARLATLTDPAHTNWFSENLADYLVARAAGEAFLQNRDYDGSAVWIGRAREHLGRAIRRDKRSRFHMNQHLTPIPQSARRVGRERGW
jgi:hypothetical protein